VRGGGGERAGGEPRWHRGGGDGLINGAMECMEGEVKGEGRATDVSVEACGGWMLNLHEGFIEIRVRC